MDKKLLGRWGEEKAASYLREKGYKIIALNYSCRFGEIDIVASDRKYIVFAEVKLRKNDKFAQAREFVTRQKQEKIIAAAQMYLQSSPSKLQPRFDVIEVYAPEGMETKRAEINHIENAFTQGY